ncbi:MAG TPA: hypothetical protein VFK13_03155 [Gemmatimonadaceae bacterium]|nr:hypothetical protein [Gemmatimonadaceae bacterium]
MRLLRPRSTVAAATMLAVGFLLPRTARAQGGNAPPEQSLTIRGIFSATLYAQDALFGLGNGQQAEFVTDETREWFHGGDVRSTRFGLDYAGPIVFGRWRANASTEFDFFGGFNGSSGSFFDEQPNPRLRLAYVDITNGSTTIRVGQYWSLTQGIVPASLSHLGTPLGWGSGGFIGWRFPGIWWQQRLRGASGGMHTTFTAAILKNSWTDKTNATVPDVGEAGIPQLEARLDFDGSLAGGGSWKLYTVGHFDQKDLTGIPDATSVTPRDKDLLNSWATEIGGQVRASALTVQGNAYFGRAMGHHFGNIIQFADIEGWGAWAQAGIDILPHVDVWLFAGTDDPHDADVRAAGLDRLRSWLTVPMARLHAGPYALSLEWLHNSTRVDTPGGEVNRTGNQILLTAQLSFSATVGLSGR